MSGARGVFIEQEVDKYTIYRIKGFYNSLFDNEFEVDYLIEGIQKEKEKEKRKEKEKEKEEKKKLEVKKSSNSSCFVVTATMGDTNHPIVQDFRDFRDEHLLTNFFGQQFVNFYYKIGPYFASLIRKNENLRNIVFDKFINPIHKKIKNVDK